MTDISSRLNQIKTNLERRAIIYESIRTFFRQERFLEVETPLRMPDIIPEKYIKPFTSDGWFLCTSPEIYMKQLLAAGYGNIFQLCHCFRKGEKGKLHQSEFAMLEWYHIGADYLGMISDTERLVESIAHRLDTFPKLHYEKQEIDITPPWPKVTIQQAFRKVAGWDPTKEFDPLRFDIDLVEKVVPSFSTNRPTVLIEYPAAAASLARLKPNNPAVAERAEVFIGGLEVTNAYSELTDPREQERRFREDMAQIEYEENSPAAIPQEFLDAVSHLPECGGIALGVDRLVMLFCNASTIYDVLPFAEVRE